MTSRDLKERIRVSSIIQQAQDDQILFRCYRKEDWGRSTRWDAFKHDKKPAIHEIFFRCALSYEKKENWGWYLMRVWVSNPERRGFLCDQKCPYTLVKDVPMAGLYDELYERYTFGKIVDDPVIMTEDYRYHYALENFEDGPPDYHGPIGGPITHDPNFAWQGYYRARQGVK